jgi:CheY-like chemotaxis protein
VVLKARNGQEGLDLATSEKPDLILLDILMPVMDGITMMQKLRKSDAWGKAVPIILLTNLSVEKKTIKRLIKENQPVFYLVKVDWSLNAIIEKAKLVSVPHHAPVVRTP